MATSGVITGLMTARDIVRAALEEIGVASVGVELSAADAAVALRSLNWMLKSWQADQVNLWRHADVSITWPAATREVTLGTNYLDLVDVRVVLDGGTERLLTRWLDGEYLSLPNKDAAGSPVIYNINKTISSITLRLWMVPAAETTILAQGVRVVEDVTDLAQNLDLPQEWTECVYMSLAARLLRPFEVEASNPALAADVKANAASLYARLSSNDQPGSYFMGPA
jgi:hypothetical protein